MLMKKALLIGLALGLIAVWAVPAMAIDWSASGYIMVLGNINRNVQSYGAGAWNNVTILPADPTRQDETGSYMAMQGQLGITARASEDLYGAFVFEMDSRMFGEAGAGPGASGKGLIAAYGADQNAVEVKNLYIDFRVPPQLPIWLRVGVQSYVIRPHVFMYADAAGITGRILIDPIKLMIRPMYAKVTDTDDYEAVTGTEFYGVDASLPIGPITPGMFFVFEDVRVEGPNPDSTNLFWIGGYVDGMVGPVKGSLDFIYNGGTIENRTIADQDYGSWLLRGALSFIWNKLEVGVGGMYVEGEDVETADVEAFQLPRNYSETLPINGDLMVFNDGWMGSSGWLRPGLITGPARAWPGFYNVRGFAYYQVVPWFKVGAQLAYIGDTVSGVSGGVGGDALGNDADNDESIGWEMAFGTNINIYKNLTLNTAFGYLFAGKALSLAGGVEPEDPWILATRLMYFF
jgi:hypothetical protein